MPKISRQNWQEADSRWRCSNLLFHYFLALGLPFAGGLPALAGFLTAVFAGVLTGGLAVIAVASFLSPLVDGGDNFFPFPDDLDFPLCEGLTGTI